MIVVSLLRGVNLGNRRIQMQPLCALYESLGLKSVRHLLQSGNVVFPCTPREFPRIGARIEDAIEEKFGFRSAVILRTAEEMQQIVSATPFAARTGLDPGRIIVHFLPADPGADCREKLAALKPAPDELHPGTRELYLYYPNGQARPTLTGPMLERALNKMQGTSRNWNTTLKLLDLSQQLHATAP
jgi:uncharacterized protein (DUF1697 family)